MINRTVVPIGNDCSIAHFLRRKEMRIQAFPFDWNLTPLSSSLRLIENKFSDFLVEDNLIFLPPTERKLFEDSGTDIKIHKEQITPVICQKYRILFPHDFSLRGKVDLYEVQEKYQRRIQRLQEILASSAEVIFVYKINPPNDWQLSQYRQAKLTFPSETETSLKKQFKNLKKQYRNIDFLSFEKFEQLFVQKKQRSYFIPIKAKIRNLSKTIFS